MTQHVGDTPLLKRVNDGNKSDGHDGVTKKCLLNQLFRIVICIPAAIKLYAFLFFWMVQTYFNNEASKPFEQRRSTMRKKRWSGKGQLCNLFPLPLFRAFDAYFRLNWKLRCNQIIKLILMTPEGCFTRLSSQCNEHHRRLNKSI